jgi:hypothetical protein
MHTAALCASAVLFKCASMALDRAIHHKSEMNARARTRSFGVHPPYEMPPDFLRLAPPSANKWVEAEPCSDFDPIHPDYTETYSEK